MNTPLISAVIMARNEELNIEEAISTLGFANQIIVADTGSRDSTMAIAAKCGAEVHSIEFDGFGTSKNRAISFAKHEWIFCMDADERVSPELAQSILSNVQDNSVYDGFSICRLSYFLGKPIRHSGWYPEYILRLFKNGKGRFCNNLVHERIELDGKQAKLSGLLHHYSYRDLESYMKKLNDYSSLNAEQLYAAGRIFHMSDLVLRPPAMLCKMYILKAGFLDGYHGFLLAGLSSFHVYMKYAKLRELCKKEKET
jgi:glycosyltransferase involved in cell wall biosynthesis